MESEARALEQGKGWGTVLTVSARYYSLSAASGLIWGGIAYFLGGQWLSAIWGGIIASPLIGLMVGLAYRPIYRLPLLACFVQSWNSYAEPLAKSEEKTADEKTLHNDPTSLGINVGIGSGLRRPAGSRSHTNTVSRH